MKYPRLLTPRQTDLIALVICVVILAVTLSILAGR